MGRCAVISDLFEVYNTPKMVRVKDRRVKCSCVLITAGIFVICLVLMITNHQYCEMVPLMKNNYSQEFWWETIAWGEAKNDRNVEYCGNGSINTDFYYSQSWQYINNECAWDLEGRHISSKLDSGLIASTSLGVFEDSGEIQTHALIVPHVEVLDFIYGMTVDIREIQTNPEYWMENQDGDFEKVDESDLDAGNLRFNVGEVLAEKGTSMDSLNAATPEMRSKVDRPPELADVDPINRLTGMRIKFKIESSNILFNDLFDTTVKTRVSIDVMENSEQYLWACEGWKLMDYPYNGRPLFNGYSCDVIVLFEVSGTYCFLSGWAILGSMIELTVLFSVASMVVDAIFGRLVGTFKRAKWVDDKHEFANQMLATKYIHAKGGETEIRKRAASMNSYYVPQVTIDPAGINHYVADGEHDDRAGSLEISTIMDNASNQSQYDPLDVQTPTFYSLSDSEMGVKRVR